MKRNRDIYKDSSKWTSHKSLYGFAVLYLIIYLAARGQYAGNHVKILYCILFKWDPQRPNVRITIL